MLGFLSTSVNKKIAIDFMMSGNTLIEIDVDADTLKDN